MNRKEIINRYNNSEKLTLKEAKEKFNYLYIEETEDYIDTDDDYVINRITNDCHIFGTYMEKVKISAYELIVDACDSLFEDAIDRIDNIDGLQMMIDYWIEQNARGADTYFPDYKYGVILK